MGDSKTKKTDPDLEATKKAFDSLTKDFTKRASQWNFFGGGKNLTSNTPMKYPYTYTAKIVQFPWKFYFQNNWIFRYYIIAIIISMPVFNFCSNLANTPDNVKKWKEIRAKEEHEHDED